MTIICFNIYKNLRNLQHQNCVYCSENLKKDEARFVLNDFASFQLIVE